MDFGPEDLLEFGIYSICRAYFLQLSCPSRFWLQPLSQRRLRPKFRYWATFRVVLAPASFVCWVVYFLFTCELTYTLIMLDSESSGVAERIYDNRFKRQVDTLDRAVGLAVNEHQAPNVRFYAACRIADMLVTSNDAVVASALKRVENAPIFETKFFGGNRLTEKFYDPGHYQVRLPVRDIVRRRLQFLRQTAQP